MSKLRVATRKSELAQTQTRFIIGLLEKSGLAAEPYFVETQGDRDQRSLDQLTGDGFFTKEIEFALLKNEADLAVHSSKDLPSMIHSQLPWVAVSDREETCDVLISKSKPHGKIKLGTSAPRRKAQLQSLFPESEICDLRGNVPGRISKVTSGALDAVVLAKAGLNRLNLYAGLKNQGLYVQDLPTVSAPCQGILGVQGRVNANNVLSILENRELSQIAQAEKSVLALLGGGCHLPLGVEISKTADTYDGRIFFQDSELSSHTELSDPRLGELVRKLHASLWKDKRLTSRVWLTQPLQNQNKVVRMLLAAGLEPVPWPLLEISPEWNIQDLDSLKLDDYSSVVVTSQFGARIFLNDWILKSTPRLQSIQQHKHVFAMGQATAAHFSPWQIPVQTPRESSSPGLAKELPKSSKPILIAGTPLTRLGQELEGQNRPFRVLNLYKSTPARWALRRHAPEVREGDKVVLTSPSAVKEFVVECAANPSLKKLKAFSIGPTTSLALNELKINHTASPKSGSWESLVDLLCKP